MKKGEKGFLVVYGNGLRLKVADDGIGLPGDTDIVAPTRKNFGMFLVHNFVKEMNGRIELADQVEGGTTILVHCPLD